MKKLILFLILSLASNLKAQSNYSGRVNLGFGSDYNLILHGSFGKFIKPNFYTGLGTGLNTPISNSEKDGIRANTYIIPLTIDLEYITLKSKISPIISVEMGGENTFSSTSYEPYESSGSTKYKLVGVITPAVGARVKLVNDVALNLKFSAYFRTAETYNISQQAYAYSLGLEF